MNKRHLLGFALGAILLVATLAGIALLSAEDRALATELRAWQASGSFHSVIPATNQAVLDGGEPLYWAVITGEHAGEGRLQSPPFAAPACVGLLVNGNVCDPSNELYFEDIESGQRYPIRAGADFAVWRRVTALLPLRWQGHLIRMVARSQADQPLDGFGVSNPRAYNLGLLLRSQISALAAPLGYVAALLLFLAPGLLGAVTLVSSQRLRSEFALSAAVLGGCLLGYLAFWAYLASARLGHLLSLAVGALSLICLALLAGRRSSRHLLADIEVQLPLLVMMLVGIFYQSLMYAVDLRAGPDYASRLRFMDYLLPDDSILPRLLADRLEQGVDPRPLTENWQSSDRPPLQAGIYLALRPLALTGLPPDAWYPSVGCVLQCSWVPAVWCLCRWGGLSVVRVGWLLTFLVFAGWVMVNSIFVWPHLLAGALAVMALVLGCAQAPGPSQRTTGLLAGAAAAFALLAHGGSAFALLVLPFGWLYQRRLPRAGFVLRLALVAGALLAPWEAYRHCYDPPGDRLVKWHLGGVRQRDRRSAWETIRDSYGRLGPGQALRNKWENVKVLVNENPAEWYFGYPPHKAGPWRWNDWKGWRRREFHTLLFALGILNLGWLSALWSLGHRPLSSEARFAGLTLSWGVLGLLVWTVMMFGPGTTVVHQGPHAIFLLLATGLAASLAGLPEPWRRWLLLLQVAWFLWIWMVTSPANAFGLPNVFLSALALTSGGALLRLLLARSKDTAKRLDGAGTGYEYSRI